MFAAYVFGLPRRDIERCGFDRLLWLACAGIGQSRPGAAGRCRAGLPVGAVYPALCGVPRSVFRAGIAYSFVSCNRLPENPAGLRFQVARLFEQQDGLAAYAAAKADFSGSLSVIWLRWV